MNTREIGIEKIDPEDETFRISETIDYPPILESIRAIGQLHPVLLLEQGGRKVLVSGFRRVRAIRELGLSRVSVVELPADCDPVQAFRTALWDNLSHRQLNALERARILSSLRYRFGVPDASIITQYLPLLGLNPAEFVLRNHLQLHRVHPVLRECFAGGRLTAQSLDAIAGLSEAAQERLAPVICGIRLSASLQKKFLGLLDDLEAIGGGLPGGPLAGPEIQEVLSDAGLTPLQKGERVYELLFRLRTPALSRAADQWAERKRRIGVPGPIRIQAHPFFEEPGLHVEFDAPDPKRFRELTVALQRVAENTGLDELFLVPDSVEPLA